MKRAASFALVVVTVPVFWLACLVALPFLPFSTEVALEVCEVIAAPFTWSLERWVRS